MTAPRVSILIPNYNNGIENPANGGVNHIQNLLQSLWKTLENETTPFEIIACDDGSTDDSLATLREWSQKQWPANSAGSQVGSGNFLTLMEEPHNGILSITANKLSRAAQGEYFARLDGDVVCLTPNWVTLLCATFDSAPPSLGVIGPKQLRTDYRIHAFGDWVLHPNGYTHIGAGLPRDAIQTALEVDHVMGCFYCHRREVYQKLEGYDESIMRGQTVDFGMRARLAGFSCRAIPHIEFIHAHGHRGARQTSADSSDGLRQALDTFKQKWGFSRIAPDLDVLRERYRATPLLWNARVFGGLSDGWTPIPKIIDKMTITNSDWGRYANDEHFKEVIHLRLGTTMNIINQTQVPANILQIGSNCGLIAHLLANQKLPVIGCDRNPELVDFATQCVNTQKYPSGTPHSPKFILQKDARKLPIDDQSSDLTLLFDQLEHHPNPVALLKEAHRVTRLDKILLIISNTARSPMAPVFPHPFSPAQLTAMLKTIGGWQPLNDCAKESNGGALIAVLRAIPFDQ